MPKRSILLIIFGVVLIYPLISFVGLAQAFDSAVPEVLLAEIRNYQLSLWICWLIFASLAIYYKWVFQKDIFFSITYGFLLIGFGIFGIYYQKMMHVFNLTSNDEFSNTLGIIVMLQNFFTALVLSIFLQLCVWWFTRRLHRR